LVSNQT